jgi:predicted DNA-binding transcriptional regulator AlpA
MPKCEKAANAVSRSLITASEICFTLNVSRRTFGRMCASGEFPRAMQRNKKWKRWLPEDVQTYLDKLKEARKN